MVDVLVVGATGYTGHLIIRYLAVHRERDSFKLGIAARSKSKLDRLVSELNLSNVQSFTVDVSNDGSIKALFDEARPTVVLSTVGPYIKWGKPLARACAHNGVHYVDIAGEASFVKDLIIELDFLATKTKSILIPSCGLDSVPSDAIAYLAAQTLRSALKTMHEHDLENVGIAESHTRIAVKGGMSGGTASSVLNIVETLSRKDLMYSQTPDYLSPVKVRSPQRLKLVSSLPIVRPKRYGGIFFLIPYNISVVQRTRGLFTLYADKFDKDGDSEDLPAYAEDYSYTESWAASNRFTAFFFSLSIAMGGACLLLFPPLRWLARKILPDPGHGPSDEALEKGFLKMHNISISTPLPTTGKPFVIESHLRGRGDPGYALTAVMASEVALSLLTAQEELPLLARKGGVLTPMTALGPILLKRLSASGRFEIESGVRDDGTTE
ncbi:hypothetical protein ACEPAI_8218 [Sanghuangporus weigelae]